MLSLALFTTLIWSLFLLVLNFLLLIIIVLVCYFGAWCYDF